MKQVIVALALIVLATCGTKPNPAFCCADEADCASVGIDEPVRLCGGGLACLDHRCVEEACVTDADCTTAEASVCRDGLCHACDATHGCSRSNPVCDVDADVCGPCNSDGDCATYAEAPRCDAAGACVACTSSSHCTEAEPTCGSDGTCRTCMSDSECASGACADDGTCADEASIVYVDVTGDDNGECSKAVPCQTLEFAITMTRPTRTRIVMAQGGYVTQGGVRIESPGTTADSVTVHGHASSLTAGQFLDNEVMRFSIPVELKDMTIIGPANSAISSSRELRLRNVRIDARNGIDASGHVIASDLSLEVRSLFGVLMRTGSRLTIDRAFLRGGDSAIRIDAVGGSFELTNVIIHGTRSTAVVALQAVNSTMRFSTITDVGAQSMTRPKAVDCGSVTIQSSIIWTPGDTRAATAGCSISSSIVGPVGVTGTDNADPLFTAPMEADFSLLSGSPALDRVDAGPALDARRAARPQGARFDLGALEGSN